MSPVTLKFFFDLGFQHLRISPNLNFAIQHLNYPCHSTNHYASNIFIGLIKTFHTLCSSLDFFEKTHGVCQVPLEIISVGKRFLHQALKSGKHKPSLPEYDKLWVHPCCCKWRYFILLWLSNIPLYISCVYYCIYHCTTSSLSIHVSMLTQVLPCFSYCKQCHYEH